MLVACILISHFALKAEIQRRPELRSKRVLIAKTRGKEQTVVDFSPALAGVRKGMLLEQALSIAGDTQVLEEDGELYKRVFKDIVSALLQYSPLVECSEIGLVYVGLEGLEPLYGGNARLVASLTNAVSQAFWARAGVGENKFIAFLAATRARPGSAYKAPQEGPAFVQGFSVDNLPVGKDIHEKLQAFKLHTLRDVASMGIGPMQGQFGPAGKLIWELSNAIDRRPFIPIREEQGVRESLSFPYEVASLGVLLRAVDMLLQRAFSKPEMRGRSVACITVECTTVISPTWSRSFYIREGVGDAARALIAVKGRLEAEHPEEAFECVAVTLASFTGEPSLQPGLVRGVHEHEKEDLVEVDRRLRARVGGQPALHKVMVLHPGHPLPEMRAVQVPVDTEVSDQVKPLQVPSPIKIVEEGGLPAWVLLGKRTSRVMRLEDRWKINLWWMVQPLRREYLKLACADGKQVTVFRDGTGNWFQQSY